MKTIKELKKIGLPILIKGQPHVRHIFKHNPETKQNYKKPDGGFFISCILMCKCGYMYKEIITYDPEMKRTVEIEEIPNQPMSP